ncbi:unnamed protein product, partial [Discosporangium mesarthrocarpum]
MPVKGTPTASPQAGPLLPAGDSPLSADSSRSSYQRRSDMRGKATPGTGHRNTSLSHAKGSGGRPANGLPTRRICFGRSVSCLTTSPTVQPQPQLAQLQTQSPAPEPQSHTSPVLGAKQRPRKGYLSATASSKRRSSPTNMAVGAGATRGGGDMGKAGEAERR